MAGRGDHDGGEGAAREGDFSRWRRGSRGGRGNRGRCVGEGTGRRRRAGGNEADLADLGVADRPGRPSHVHRNAGHVFEARKGRWLC